MTLHNLTEQLYDLSVAGYFNGEKFTKERLERYIYNLMIHADTKVIIMEIALPDARWNFKISRWVERGSFQFDYYIPETREDEYKMLVEMGWKR